jgi:hypothetical protein
MNRILYKAALNKYQPQKLRHSREGGNLMPHLESEWIIRDPRLRGDDDGSARQYTTRLSALEQKTSKPTIDLTTRPH